MVYRTYRTESFVICHRILLGGYVAKMNRIDLSIVGTLMLDNSVKAKLGRRHGS